MYGRCKKIIFLLMIICALGLHAKNLKEDAYIFEALDALDKGDIREALRVYDKLYLETKNIEYLKEKINLSMQLNALNDALKYANEYRIYNQKDAEVNNALARILVNFGRTSEAIELYEKLIKDENRLDYRRNLGFLYYAKQDFTKARELILSAYNEEPSEMILLTLINIDAITGDFKRSIPLIRGFYQSEISELMGQSLSGIAKHYNITILLEELFTSYYDKLQSTQNAMNLLRIYIIKEDFAKALVLLKRYDLDRNLAIDLYIMQKDYKNARIEVNKAFAESEDRYYLGILAIIDFEEAKDKKAVLDGVISGLKSAATHTNNHIFYNYLGYLLIDYDIDINNGIKYVEKALLLDPDNFAYLDSLAWGYYKKKDCKQAQIIMNRITRDEIDSQEDIKEHLEKINQCLAK